MVQFYRPYHYMLVVLVYVYFVSFLIYSTLNRGVPLKSGLRIIPGHWKKS